MVDFFGQADAFKKNVDLEYERNGERYTFLRWGRKPSRTSASCRPAPASATRSTSNISRRRSGRDETRTARPIAYPDTLVGTDSHTTMVNGLSVLGWGVGGIEAEAAMLGQPISMLIPEVIGFRLTGKLPEGTTATDLVLTVTQMLRKKGVVGKFVEFYGPGLANLTLEDQATIANMAPEYGATCGFFPIDDDTHQLSSRPPAATRTAIALVEAYAKAQGMWREDGIADPVFTDTLSSTSSTVVPSLAGPKRPQDRVALTDVATDFARVLPELQGDRKKTPSPRPRATRFIAEGATGARRPRPRAATPSRAPSYGIGDGDVVIAAITSCTNTSNPNVLVARRPPRPQGARERASRSKPWVKTSLAPGSQVVTEYLEKAGLQKRPRRARLQPRRLWLHHLHRQFRPAAGGDLRGDHRERPRRLLGAVGQPQLRGPRQSGRAGELPRLAAAGRRLRARRLDERRHHQGAARQRTATATPSI